MDYGHWQYMGEFDPSKWFGFIYRIIDTKTDKEYIGKKQFHSKLTKPPLKGKLRKRKIIKESDWKSYTSSSTHINLAITDRCKEDFLFLIESLHKTKASLHYAEVEIQVMEDVLRARLPNGDRKYYNGMIANIKFLPPVEVPEEAHQKIRTSCRTVYLNTDNYCFDQMTDEEKEEWRAKYRLPKTNIA